VVEKGFGEGGGRGGGGGAVVTTRRQERCEECGGCAWWCVCRQWRVSVRCSPFIPASTTLPSLVLNPPDRPPGLRDASCRAEGAGAAVCEQVRAGTTPAAAKSSKTNIDKSKNRPGGHPPAASR
jgi:hypothetical protein